MALALLFAVVGLAGIGVYLAAVALGVALVAYLGVYFADEGLNLTLDIVNWSFLAAILLLVGSPRELVGLVGEAGRTVGQILVQYPLYAGILGMMTATGLVGVLADFFVRISTPTTLGFWGMISGGIVNMFIPSGGGQFAVQAPIFMEAARQLGVEAPPVIMAIAYGDQWTNMIQPFWAIPILTVTRLRFGDVVGFSLLVFVACFVVSIAAMLMMGTLLALPHDVIAAPAPDYAVKAAYLAKFALFVEWPEAAFDSSTSPVNLCVAGTDPFGTTLDRLVEGERIDPPGRWSWLTVGRPPVLIEVARDHLREVFTVDRGEPVGAP